MDIIQVFEDVVDQLPEIYRTVLIMRDVEGMSVAESAAILNVDVETVKMRLQQGRTLLKGSVKGYLTDVFQAAFPLQDEMCGRVTAGVTDALRWTMRLSDRERACSPVASSARATTGRACSRGRRACARRPGHAGGDASCVLSTVFDAGWLLPAATELMGTSTFVSG